MNIKSKYGIANKNSVVLDFDTSTTPSRYQAEGFTVFRKFMTREAARTYKKSLKAPQRYAIIQMATGTIVR